MIPKDPMSDHSTLHTRKTSRPTWQRRRRPAFTTIELLITVAIIATVTALALPTVKETLRHNALTRATNAVSGAFLNARTLAARDGKPYGVRLERLRRDITPGQSGGRVGLSDANLNNANVCQRIVYVGAAGETGRLTIGDPSLPIGAPGADVGGYLLQTLNPTAVTAGDRSWLLFIPRSASEYLYAAIDQSNASFVSNLIGVGSRVTLYIRGEYPGNNRAVLRGQIADRVMNVDAEPTLVNVAGEPTLNSLITDAAVAPVAGCTDTPRARQASRSMLSSPTPSRPTARKRGAAARSSASTIVRLRTMIASATPIASSNAERSSTRAGS